MRKTVSALLLILSLGAQALSAAYLPKDRKHFDVLTHKGHMIFNFNLANGASFAPSTPAKFRVYIDTPTGKRIPGPVIDGQSPTSFFRVIVKPPILFGTYTIVVQDLNIPSNQQNLIDQGVIVTNSLNTKQAEAIVQAPQRPSAPANPGDTIIGYFNPTREFFAH